MDRKQVGQVAVGLLLACSSRVLCGQVPTAEAPSLPALLRVVLHDAYGLSAGTREGMRRQMTEIFLRAGIELQIAGGELNGSVLHLEKCVSPVKLRRIDLWLLSGQDEKIPEALGVAGLTEDERYQVRVFPGLVKQLARAAEWGEAELLGLVASHELGHLLIPLEEHAQAGIMQANWEPSVLRRMKHTWFLFLPEQAEAMRNSLLERPGNKVT